jgi:hypothetical protein
MQGRLPLSCSRKLALCRTARPRIGQRKSRAQSKWFQSWVRCIWHPLQTSPRSGWRTVDACLTPPVRARRLLVCAVRKPAGVVCANSSCHTFYLCTLSSLQPKTRRSTAGSHPPLAAVPAEWRHSQFIPEARIQLQKRHPPSSIPHWSSPLNKAGSNLVAAQHDLQHGWQHASVAMLRSLRRHLLPLRGAAQPSLLAPWPSTKPLAWMLLLWTHRFHRPQEASWSLLQHTRCSDTYRDPTCDKDGGDAAGHGSLCPLSCCSLLQRA